MRTHKFDFHVVLFTLQSYVSSALLSFLEHRIPLLQGQQPGPALPTVTFGKNFWKRQLHFCPISISIHEMTLGRSIPSPDPNGKYKHGKSMRSPLRAPPAGQPPSPHSSPALSLSGSWAASMPGHPGTPPVGPACHPHQQPSLKATGSDVTKG